MGRYIQQAPAVNSIVEAIAQNAAKAPNHLALRIGKEVCTYAQLWNLIQEASSKMLSFQAQSIILLSAEKALSFITHYFAAHLNGLICILVDPKLSVESLTCITNCYDIKAFLSSKQHIEGVTNIHYHSAASGEIVRQYQFPSRDSIADYMFTTGTTGEKKCVPLSHGNILASATNINAFIGNTQQDHELIALPLCHSFGLGRIRCALLAGGSCTVIPNFANERKLLSVLSEEGITGFSMVPAAWLYIRHLCANKFIAAAQKLRFIEIGSAPLTLEEKQFLESSLPHTRICMHYGLTEASRSAFMEFHADAAHLASSGKASPGVEIAIFSTEGKQLSANEPGEVCVRGAHVTKGYLNYLRDDYFYNGFFRTGDVGKIDSDGFLYILGRIKEQINVGGKKVSPDEVEQLIQKLPGVKECACTAAPDPDGILGEIVKVHIVPDGSTALSISQIIQFMRGQVEPHKIPKIVEFREVPLPRTDSGKLQRQKLR
ncbi:MAG: acyl--CoA ligase [Akkermansia sp.]|nr:acyl--CoA ligase [Akkermansia sp.]